MGSRAFSSSVTPAASIVPLVMTVDPSLEFEEAKSVAVKFFDDPYTYNGIRYAFAHYAGTYYMNISIK